MSITAQEPFSEKSPHNARSDYQVSINLISDKFDLPAESPTRELEAQPTASNEMIYDHLQEGACLLDEEMTVCFWNRAMVELTGVEKTAAENRPLFDLLPLCFKQAMFEKIRRTITEQRAFDERFQFPDKNKRLFAFRFKATPFKDANIPKSAVLLTLSDVSDALRLKKAVEQQQHTAAIGQLSVGVAQELTAPLHEIYQGVDQILERTNSKKSKALYGALSGVINQAYRISFLTHNLIALSRQSRPNLVALEFDKFIFDTVENYEQDYAKTLRMNLSVVEDLPSVLGDPLLLSIALQNLFMAVEHFAGDDTIPRLSVDVDKNNPGFVNLQIRDKDMRLSLEEIHNMFELFHIETQVSPGASLGLFISKKLIEAQGCRFQIEEAANSGTVFEIKAPIFRKR